MAHVGVAGAGVLGRLMSLLLSEQGLQVSLFDRDAVNGENSCSWAGAGMLAPWAELEKAEPVIAELGGRSLDLWPEIITRLENPVFFDREGSLVIAHRQDWSDLETFKNNVSRRLGDSSVMQTLTAQDITALEPHLGDRFQRGVFFPNEGQLEPRELLPALANCLLNRGVHWFEKTEIIEVSAFEIRTQAETHSFDYVVDTRGLDGGAQWDGLRGVRGELLRLHAPEVELKRPVRLMHPRYPLYIAPRPGSVFLIGATSIESADRRGLTVRSGLELLSALYSLSPAFGEAEILESVVDCRPAFADNLPRVSHEEGLSRINGLYRHGFLISPALALDATAHIMKHHFSEEGRHASSHA